MITPWQERAISAPSAAEYAHITYRQLDHWARRGWVTPSVQSGAGRGGRRLYSVDDVLRLAALRHFAQSGWAVSDIGGRFSEARIDQADWLVVGTESGVFSSADDAALLATIRLKEKFSAFPLKDIRCRLDELRGSATAAVAEPISQIRRTA